MKSVYRLSLAIADFMMDVIRIPTYVETMYKDFVQNPAFSKWQHVTGFMIIMIALGQCNRYQ